MLTSGLHYEMTGYVIAQLYMLITKLNISKVALI